MRHRITLAAAAAAALFSTAPVHALTLAFSGSGVVQGPAQSPPFFVGLTIGPADADYTVGGQSGWDIDVAFSGSFVHTFDEYGNLIIVGGWIGTMTGRFLRGADSLDFTGNQTSDSPASPITLTYNVIGGTGAFAGYTGSGSSTVALTGNPFGLPTPVPFMESGGVLNLQPVPEPGAWALMAAGLLAVGWRVRRGGMS